MKNFKSFTGGLVLGLVSLSICLASVPKGRVTDDTAIYQNMSEIQLPRQGRPNFDADINRLAQLEGHYREKLPSLSQHGRLKPSVQRISQQSYRYSGESKAARAARLQKQ